MLNKDKKGLTLDKYVCACVCIVMWCHGALHDCLVTCTVCDSDRDRGQCNTCLVTLGTVHKSDRMVSVAWLVCCTDLASLIYRIGMIYHNLYPMPWQQTWYILHIQEVFWLVHRYTSWKVTQDVNQFITFYWLRLNAYSYSLAQPDRHL